MEEEIKLVIAGICIGFILGWYVKNFFYNRTIEEIFQGENQ